MGSVFILLGVSLVGSLAPVVLSTLARRPWVGVAVRLGTYFGEQAVAVSAGPKLGLNVNVSACFAQSACR